MATESTVTVLERKIYSEAEAARLLRVPKSTLNYWLEGGERRGKTYKPVIRPEPLGGHPDVTWAEFIEAGLLRAYRRHQVPMAELRDFIDRLRDNYGTPYPLAHHRPFVADRKLLRKLQDAAHLEADFALVAEVSGQLILTPASESFFLRVQWEGDVAAGWRPHEDPYSPVRIFPNMRFGRPAVSGISTEILWEHVEAGEDIGEVAEGFELSVDEVRWALAYETSLRAA